MSAGEHWRASAKNRADSRIARAAAAVLARRELRRGRLARRVVCRDAAKRVRVGGAFSNLTADQP